MTPADSYLAERGITAETVQKHGIEIDREPTSERFRNRLGFDAFKEGKLADLAKEVIWFPCPDVTGKQVSWIARLLPAIGDAKFLNAKGGAYPFIQTEAWEARDKPHKPLILTEGPVKALALVQAGHPAIGVSGVWMATRRGDNEHIELVSALKEFTWQGRTAYLAFDADSVNNPSVKQALFRTFLALYKLGAKVRFLTWLLSEGKGIDDYLVGKQAAGKEPAGALTKLLDAAHEVNSILVPEELTMVQKELASANLTCSQVSQISQILSKALKVRASALEQDAIDSCAGSTNKAFELADPEPWPDPVNGADLLGEMVELLRRHLVMSEEQAVAVALWAMLTYVEAHVDTLPILAITSPQKRCGKSTLLSILRRLVRKPLPTSSVSPAALFRCIEKWRPALLIDEADTFLKQNDELRGVLNAGHTRDMAFVLRANPETLDPERFSTWSPKAIACIGKLPETLADRSVEIRLQRKPKSEETVPLRDTSPETLERLTRQLMRWALDNGERIKTARPPVPGVLNDRAADNWRPALAIAEALGGNWLVRATEAAVVLGADDNSEETTTIVLLMKLRDLFKHADFLPTTAIVDALNTEKEAPWADWKNGTGITAEKLARILKPFGVKSGKPRRGGERHAGYSIEDLVPVFDRYLPSCPPASPENYPQLGPSLADQVSEPLHPGPGSSKQPEPGQVDFLNPDRSKSAPRADSRARGPGCTGLKGGIDKGSLNGHPLVAFAARIFDGEIVTPDELEPNLACAPEPEPTANPAPKAKPHPRPAHSALENLLIAVLEPRDYDGGLSYGEWRRLAKLPQDIFDQTLKSLCRRGGPVYESALNNRYQLSPRFAKILANQKNPAANGSTQPSDLP